MHPVLEHLIKTNFADLQGSRVDGRIAVSDDLINLGLHELVATLTKSSSAGPSPSSAPAQAPKEEPAPYGNAPTKPEPTPDPRALLGKLDVEKLQYRTESGRTILEIACAVKK